VRGGSDLTLGVSVDIINEVLIWNGEEGVFVLLPSSHSCIKSNIIYEHVSDYDNVLQTPEGLPTEVNVLLPRPSWQFTTIGVFGERVFTTTSISSIKSEKSGGRSAVIGIRW
jgi:hypothetical protein